MSPVSPSAKGNTSLPLRARYLLLCGTLQHLHDGSVDFILETLARQDIQDRVQTNVEKGQASCDRVSIGDVV